MNLLPLEEGEKIQAVLPVREFDEDHFVFMATSHGTVKKTPLTAFAFQRRRGIIAVEPRRRRRAWSASQLTDGNRDILLFASNGKAIRFAEDEVRPMGRKAAGVRGMRLAEGAQVVIADRASTASGDVLTATERGYGKRTPLDGFPAQGPRQAGRDRAPDLRAQRRAGRRGAGRRGARADADLQPGTLVRTRVAEISARPQHPGRDPDPPARGREAGRRGAGREAG